MTTYTIKAKLWLYSGHAAWHFLTTPKNISEKIKKKVAKGPRRGWGSVRVEATIGKSKWKTSIFPDSREGSYLLPVKADVRKREELLEGDMVPLKLRLL
jgi:hypothetical protein